jgi:hypothetical protein
MYDGPVIKPWGWVMPRFHRIEWQGDWSDKSRLWTPELRQELGHSRQEDGVFWMPFHDFLTYFHVINVCKVPQVETDGRLDCIYDGLWPI